MTPYGYMRVLTIETNGKEHTYTVGFEKIARQTKDLKIGDKIRIDYQNYDNFRIKRI